jgi:hypothetical protein
MIYRILKRRQQYETETQQRISTDASS